MNDNNCRRNHIYPGLLVDIVLKKTNLLANSPAGRSAVC